MAKYARGKKSQAISDVGGLRVPYTQLKTTWDGLRVSPEDFDPKQPQLTPAKNVVDATALLNGRPDTDPENVVVFIGYTQDWTVDSRLRTNRVGVEGLGTVGFVSNVDRDYIFDVTGVSGTGATGTATVSDNEDVVVTGLAGTGNIASEEDAYIQYSITVANSGSGNRYYVDSVLQQQLYLQEGQTYRFDQSNSSNSGHPLRFSTTANGTHAGGSEYTTGVLTGGTPGSAGAYTEITVAVGAPTLYYYCTNHSLMGGTSYTPSSGTVSLAITVANSGSGNRYYIDGAGPAITISLTEGSTYLFDQSASSNSGHPLRFSTTENGTHGGGSEYTTGVTTSGTAGQANAYTQIVVADSAPTLYYYCTNHSNMGGQLNTPAITVVSGIEQVGEMNATGVAGTGAIGTTSEITNEPHVTGVAGTGDTGSQTLFITTDVFTGSVFGTGAIGSELIEMDVLESGVAGTGALGNETFEGSPAANSAVGTGAIGTEIPEVELGETGVAGTGEVAGFGISGDGNIQLLVTGISGIGATGAVGEEISASEAIETGVAGTGAIGTASILTGSEGLGWGIGEWGAGAWQADTLPRPASVSGTGAIGTVGTQIETSWGVDGYGEGTWQ